MFSSFTDLKQELNIRTVPNDSRSFNEKTNSDNRQVEIETQTAVTTTTVGAEGTNSSPHPMKRKFSLVFKFARRAFRRSKRAPRERESKRNVTIH